MGKPLLTFIAVLSMILNLDLYSQIDSNGIFQKFGIKEVEEKIKVDGVLDEPFGMLIYSQQVFISIIPMIPQPHLPRRTFF